MQDIDGNGKVDQVTASFSETARRLHGHDALDAHQRPQRRHPGLGLDLRLNRHPDLTEGAGAANTAVGTFKVALAANATGIRDAAANLSSFAATAPTDRATPVLVTLTMHDTNPNGKVDHVVAVFSETLAAYTAGTTPWTLANVPTGGTLASVAVATTTATLTITEGAGAADTAVGSFTVALATNATGVRDAAGNQASFATTTPTDNAKPVLVAGSRDERHQRQRQGRPGHRQLLRAARPSRARPPGRSPTSPAPAPWPPSRPPAQPPPSPSRGRRRRQHRRGHLQRRPRSQRHRHPRRRRQPATSPPPPPPTRPPPCSSPSSMQDTNTNGKVDHVVAVFSETLTAYTAGTTPWTLANVPSGGTLASVAVATTTATLTITEGAGAADTAVGSFTVALATNPTGIRDAAGNQATFATTTPTDSAKPVPVGIGRRTTASRWVCSRQATRSSSRSAKRSRPRSGQARRSPIPTRAVPATTD